MVLKCTRPTAIRNPLSLDSSEDRIKLFVTNLERQVVAVEVGGVVKIQREGVVHLDGSEVAGRAVVPESKDAGEESRRGFLVARRDDGVIEFHRVGGWVSWSAVWTRRLCGRCAASSPGPPRRSKKEFPKHVLLGSAPGCCFTVPKGS